jgi:hypothetical protein
MPLIFALVASLGLHAAALLGPGWGLPLSHEPDLPVTKIDAVIAPAVPRNEALPAKTAQTAPVAKPRIVAANPVAATENAPAPPPELAAAPAPPPEPAPAPAPAPAPVVEATKPQPARTALPGRGRARFTVTRGEGGFAIGQATYTWEHDGFRYRLKNLIETTGLAAVFRPVQSLASSEGEVTEDGLRPTLFRQERVGGVDVANFDWLGRFVTYAGRRESIVNGTQDLLSLYFQLVLLAPTQGVVEMPIATGRKLETYRFEVLGETLLPLPGGERRTIHLRALGGGDTIEIWMASGEGATARGMPLKIRFIDRKGELFDQIAVEAGTEEKQ